jgi:enoyl-[acyl-carrier protein] reductase/trans-2-enoyl-CoA reductase (NAD+)
LVIYSLAAGARRDEATGEAVRSHIKTVGEDALGKTIDLADMTIKDLLVTQANEQEILDTVFVMGGSDWKAWIDILEENKLLNEGFKTISYTYIGGPTTDKIYRGGTLGRAKEDLENSASSMNQRLKETLGGEALISSSKAVVTKASVFIPQMPHYVSCLFEVMMKHGVHETIIEHKYRLFKDMIYGNKRIIDEKKRIRLDHLEMEPKIQHETIELMTSLPDDAFFELKGTKQFLKEVFQIHGFEYDEIDYEADLNMDELSELKPE